MWLRATIAFLLLSLACLEAGPRAASWKLEALPGAQRLAVVELNWLVLPPDAGELLIAAGEDLASVAAAHGSGLEVVREGRPKHAILCEIRGMESGNWKGESGKRKGESGKWKVESGKIEADERLGAFSIHRERTRVHLRANSEEGLVNGLYAIAANWYGARWYWDGELGLELVHAPLGEVPSGFWREAPAFVQRHLSPRESVYARRNRLNRPYRFNHNLAHIFDRAVFEAEPEVFPIIQGARILPEGSRQTDPQPEFTNPRTVEIAAEAAIEHFEANPESLSFSLSINDNILFDESAWTELVVSPLQYFRQRPDYTNLVFGFMNSVAKKVFDEAGLWETASGQPRYLTALAYYWTEQSPVIPIHPRVMPVLTSDRAQWQDPGYRTEDRALIERWAQSGAERIATWDYYFGAPFPYPRQFTGWIDESLKHLHAQGVDVFYSQLPSVWGLDGPKAWLTAELLWDPTQAVEPLLDEYYTHFFGPAAEPMRDFYDLAEQHRDAHAGKADWIKFYLDEAGIEMMLPVLPDLRACLDEAAALVDSDSRYAARVQLVSDAFRFTEQYAAYYEARLALLRACMAGELVEPLVSDFGEARSAYEQYFERLLKDPLFKRMAYFKRLAQSDPMPLALMQMAEAPEDESDRRLWEVAQAFKRHGGDSVLPNPDLKHHSEDPWQEQSFLGPALPNIEGWSFWLRPYEHFTVEGTATGRGVRFTGADMCSLSTELEVQPNQAFVLEVATRYRVSPDNRNHIMVYWYDADGNELESILPLQFPNGASSDRLELSFPLIAPEGAERVQIIFLVSRQYEGDFFEVQRVDLKAVDGGRRN